MQKEKKSKFIKFRKKMHVECEFRWYLIIIKSNIQNTGVPDKLLIWGSRASYVIRLKLKETKVVGLAVELSHVFIFPENSMGIRKNTKKSDSRSRNLWNFRKKTNMIKIA